MLSLQLQLQVPLSYLFPVISDRLGKYISFLMKHNIVLNGLYQVVSSLL